ncbi:bcl-2-like protein 1 [Nephila pilipes]|uniref:Bcl-2-like protein 1 n=1 Tax=Nephila pilipes TaxID=299642 RepID=A0A8X6U803_NEPPI|nr:bcl-2-like protein 1 [Nephila pilipes]
MENNGIANSGSEITTNGDRNSIDSGVADVVSEFLQHKLSQNGYQWNSPLITRGAGNRHAKAGTALCALADEFVSHYKDQFQDMCDQLDIRADTMKPTIEGVANELFGEGIKWSRIVAFFVFGSELAVHCKDRNSFDLINIIAYSQSAYISEKLLPWINDHGGWDKLKCDDEEGHFKKNYLGYFTFVCFLNLTIMLFVCYYKSALTEKFFSL